ncbi:hypothetical protein M569_08230, partial [Genlisea aurea]
SKTTSKTQFFEYLQREMDGNKFSAEEDIATERRLAKKLRLKNGSLGISNDDLDKLLDGVPSVLANPTNSQKHSEESDDMNTEDEDMDNEFSDDEIIGSSEEEATVGGTETELFLDNATEDSRSDTESDVSFERQPAKKRKGEDDTVNISSDSSKKNIDKGVSGSLMLLTEKTNFKCPGKYIAPHLRPRNISESAEHVKIRNRLRGLLNRLSETNLEGITADVCRLFHSVGRSVGSQIISEEVVESCSSGPRGNEQYAAVFAAFVAGMACSVGMDFGAKILDCLAKCFEEEYMKEDNISLQNLTLLLSYIYVFGVCSSELIYDFLIMLGKRLTEVDVSTVLTVLQCCGMKLRADDPVGMKNFISSIQNRAKELKTSAGDEKSKIRNKRMEFMIETICDIKNNKRKTKEDPLQHTRIKKWLQKLRVEDILLRGLKWSKLIDPDKKGQWWLSGLDNPTVGDIKDAVADSAIYREIPENAKMLELAASQRMNTDARRAIFCVIMSGEDYIDAFEKLIRLNLTGKQDREISRVLVECCLQERVFNKYYCILASKLCSYSRNHRTSLQFCLWDHFKELDNMELTRSINLAKFTAEMIGSLSISLGAVKVADLGDPTNLSPKRRMHFGVMFEKLLEFSDELVSKVFARVGTMRDSESFASGIEFFVSRCVVSEKKYLGDKFEIVKRAL